MDNSEILKRVLVILKQRKAGKRITRDFAQFVRDYEDTKRAFHLTYPEISGKLDSDESV